MDARKRREPRQQAARNSGRTISPGAAAILSLFVPGLGQMCKGRIGRGIAFLIATIIGYLLLILPGVVLHIVSVVDAATKD